jgi:hypothetical protein
MARVIEHGARLSAVRLARAHAAWDVLGGGTWAEEARSENRAWLAGSPAAVEDQLLAQRTTTTPVRSEGNGLGELLHG